MRKKYMFGVLFIIIIIATLLFVFDMSRKTIKPWDYSNKKRETQLL